MVAACWKHSLSNRGSPLSYHKDMASQLPGPTQPSVAEMQWIDQHGHEQLGQLNAMERGQDRTTWSNNALYSTTIGVLVVGTIAALGHPQWWLIESVLGILGAFMSTAWFLILIRAHKYELEYLNRAKWLQHHYKVPERCAVWQNTLHGSSCHGVSSFSVLKVYISSLYWAWVIVTLSSWWLVLLSEKLPWTDDTVGWRIVLTIVAAIVAAGSYYLYFHKQSVYVDCYINSVKRDLGV